MISCVEFIPAYSELFSFIDENYGHKDVEKFWAFLFKPDGKGIPLINYAKKDGIRGCWDYWCGTLTEEAANVTLYMNEKEGWQFSHMSYCPSKGRLLELQKETGFTPYYDYCGHCDFYRSALNEVGLTWIRNHLFTDKAECSRVLYDPKVFKGVMTMDENVEVFEMTADKAEYFHRDFHSSLNMGIDYLYKTYGENDLNNYLKRYTLNLYTKVFEGAKEDPLTAVEEKIIETYSLERALDALKTVKTKDGLTVNIRYCPAVKHLKETGREVSDKFYLSTLTVMQTIADKVGLNFTWVSYNHNTGECEYKFTK